MSQGSFGALVASEPIAGVPLASLPEPPKDQPARRCLSAPSHACSERKATITM